MSIKQKNGYQACISSMKTKTIGKNLALILIIFLAISIRIYRADESFGGFHGFNEAWYTIIAENYTARTLLNPRSYLGTIDYNVPPLFSYASFLIFRIFGISEFTARLVPIFFSIMLIWFVFALANLIYGWRAALAAAMLLAVMPASVIVGRNVQVDSMYTALIVAFIYFYMRARETSPSVPLNEPPCDKLDSKHKYQDQKITSTPQHSSIPGPHPLFFWGLAGFMLGAALLAKQPAALSIGIIITWEIIARRNLRFLNKQFAFMCAIALAIAMSFYLPHLLLHTKPFIAKQIRQFIVTQSGVEHALTTAQYFMVLKELAGEVLWGLSPPITLLAVIALPFSFTRARRDPMPVIALAFFATFFLLFHKHVYYMLPATVFATLIAGSLWRSEHNSFTMNALLAAIVILTTFVSLFLLCKVKYGRNEFQQFGDILAARGIRNVDIITGDTILSSYGPIIQYYAPDAAIHTLNRLSLNADGTAKLSYNSGFILLFDASYKHNFPEHTLIPLTSDVEGIELFGYVIHPNCSEHEPFAQTFTPSHFVIKKIGTLTGFGLRRVATRTSFKFLYLPPNYKLKKTGNVFQIVNAHSTKNK
jgi:4-amino-4-deoxy-L-arabinose transferase-like glycosyltransferase